MSYFSQLTQRRRSIRKYRAEEIDPDLLTDIVECALRAPTSRNSRSVRLIIVDDPETIRALSGIREHGSAFVAGASVVIAVCADTTVTRRPLADTAIAASICSWLPPPMTSVAVGATWRILPGLSMRRPRRQSTGCWICRSLTSATVSSPSVSLRMPISWSRRIAPCRGSMSLSGVTRPRRRRSNCGGGLSR